MIRLMGLSNVFPFLYDPNDLTYFTAETGPGICLQCTRSRHTLPLVWWKETLPSYSEPPVPNRKSHVEQCSLTSKCLHSTCGPVEHADSNSAGLRWSVTFWVLPSSQVIDAAGPWNTLVTRMCLTCLTNMCRYRSSWAEVGNSTRHRRDAYLPRNQWVLRMKKSSSLSDGFVSCYHSLFGHQSS